MKRVIFTRIGVWVAIFLFGGTTWACNLTDLSLLSVTSLGSGQYALELKFCVGAGRTGTSKGADSDTRHFAFFLSTNATFASFPTSLTSPASGAIYEDTLLGPDSLFYYSPTDEVWACVTSTALCGNVRSECITFTVVTNGLPESLWVRGAEAGGNIAAGCQGSDMIVYPAQFGCPIEPNFAINPPVCGSTGNISVSPSGGQAPYTYLWSTGATTSSIQNVPLGIYTVTITDASSCSIYRPAEMLYQGYISPNVIVTNYDCATGLGKLAANPSGGSAPYSYTWSTGATTFSISNLTTGSYYLTVTDANGCTSGNYYYSITTVSALQATGAITHYDCASSMGSIDLTPTGGVPPYTYSWSNGATTQDITGLAAGSYTVTIHHVNGTCQPTFSFTVNANSVTANLGSDKTMYRGYSPQACATLNPSTSGGASPYTRLWSTGATTSTINVCPTATTTYTVTVTDARGCTATDAIVVNVVDVRCGVLNNMVKVCHSGTTLCVNHGQVNGHLNHGDYLGNCQNKSGSPVMEIPAELRLSAYPNPAVDGINFELSAPISGRAKLEIYDLLGKRLTAQENIPLVAGETMTVRFETAGFVSGIYVAHLQHENGEVANLKFSVTK